MKKRKRNFSVLVSTRFSPKEVKEIDESMRIRGCEGESRSEFIRTAVKRFAQEIRLVSE